MFAPKGTPTNIIDKLANNLDAALEEPADQPGDLFGEFCFLPHHFGRTMFFSRAITEPLVSAVAMRGRADDGFEAERWL